VERHVLELIGELQAEGINPLLILFHDAQLAGRARQRGSAPVILRNPNRLLFQTARQLAARLARDRIGVVHVHGYKAMVFCSLARVWHPFRIVRTVHGLPELTSGGLATALRARFYHRLDAAASRVTGATVCYVTEDLRARHGHVRPRSGETAIPNGIGSIATAGLRRPVDLQQRGFNLVAVGRLEPVKGLHIAITAVASETVPHDVHLHLIGAGPSESALRALSREVGIEERVHFLGFRRDVYAFLSHCDVLLMPSVHEGLPYTLLEAMALGTAIVASRVGGLAEVLQDEVTALLVPPLDAASLARAILRLHSSAELRSFLGANAQRIQRDKYSAKAMTARYLAVYRAVTRAGQ
jgi:glycosyltransferase involved in cell wall biosynthesis